MCKNTESCYQYSEIPFSYPENEQRYAEYASLNPGMCAEDVVWRVNNNLDKEKYKFDIPVSGYDDLYIIVNKYFKLSSDYCPPDLVEADGCLMRSFVAEAYMRMRDAASAEGFSVSVTSAFRSCKDQENIYNRMLADSTVEEVDKTCARPCYSEHQTGMAIDVQGSIPGGRNIHKTPEAAWVVENCCKFGFILRYLPEIVEITGYASEPWHLRYIGTEASLDMKKKGIQSFEEYKERFLRGAK